MKQYKLIKDEYSAPSGTIFEDRGHAMQLYTQIHLEKVVREIYVDRKELESGNFEPTIDTDKWVGVINDYLLTRMAHSIKFEHKDNRNWVVDFSNDKLDFVGSISMTSLEKYLCRRAIAEKLIDDRSSLNYSDDILWIVPDGTLDVGNLISNSVKIWKDERDIFDQLCNHLNLFEK